MNYENYEKIQLLKQSYSHYHILTLIDIKKAIRNVDQGKLDSETRKAAKEKLENSIKLETLMINISNHSIYYLLGDEFIPHLYNFVTNKCNEYGEDKAKQQ